ncbi:hypothetical protein FSARC_2119 [Fusarium sarcochroum]|uniref:Elongin-C n=1 Tax=Fusarium sarcochroum TaxID=1208366 RepID=A0A8H4XD95_9HYPO|nr:hypothetical protein FSARC_2119 [Fusarium sarcochroum]
MDLHTPSKYITLVSGDGFEFVVLRDAALVSPIIKGMLDVRSQFAEAKDARCVFQEMRTIEASLAVLRSVFTGIISTLEELDADDNDINSAMVLDKVVEYFHYWYRYRNSEDVPDMEIPVELCLELLAAADYLGLDQYAAQPRIATAGCFDTNLTQGEHEHEVKRLPRFVGLG